ncbi:MAG: hypothetical protein HYU57_09565 [Micavibrio aeruginosavorus]|nr:hypothetical protein [Micavibrio aeruginosavorus]
MSLDRALANKYNAVTPAKAGAQQDRHKTLLAFHWIPAFAGMTMAGFVLFN